MYQNVLVINEYLYICKAPSSPWQPEREPSSQRQNKVVACIRIAWGRVLGEVLWIREEGRFFRFSHTLVFANVICIVAWLYSSLLFNLLLNLFTTVLMFVAILICILLIFVSSSATIVFANINCFLYDPIFLVLFFYYVLNLFYYLSY